MKKEQTDEQVQDNLQNETGGGNGNTISKTTGKDKYVPYILILLIVAVIILLFYSITF